MKKSKDVLKGFAVLLLAVLFITACSGKKTAQAEEVKDDGKAIHKDFYGTWVWGIGNGEETYIISDKEIREISTYADGSIMADNTYSIEDVTQMENTNDNYKANYPSGFRFDLKVTAVNGGDSNFFTVGEKNSKTFFLHTGKKEFWNNLTGYARRVYKKQ